MLRALCGYALAWASWCLAPAAERRLDYTERVQAAHHRLWMLTTGGRGTL